MREIFLFLLPFVTCGNCPPKWHKDPLTGVCYMAFESEKASWNEAQTVCQTYGGDLASVANQEEQNYILSVINRNHFDCYWIGLNDLAKPGTYEWISTDGNDACPYTFKWWAKGMPTDNNGARCTFMLFSDHFPGDDDKGQLGKWTKGVCSTKNKFVCQTNQMPNKCPAGYNYVAQLDKCYHVTYSKKMWHEAINNCQNIYSGSLVNINNEMTMTALTNYLIEQHQKRIDKDQPVLDMWMGLSDYDSPGTLTWSINHTPPSYTNWAFGQPNTDQDGNQCAFLPATIDMSNKWQTAECGTRDKGYVCEVASGKTCPNGWTYFKVNDDTEKCVLFVVNGAEHVPWWEARQYCQRRGASFYIPESDAENDGLARFSSDWERAGVTRLWLGASSDDETCQFELDNGYPIDYTAWSLSEPNCEGGVYPKCVYFNIFDRQWHTADNCYTKEAFACTVQVGQAIHDVPITPRDHYCKQNPDLAELPFMYYEDDIVGPMCYQFFKNSGNPLDQPGTYDESVARCTGQGAQIASIHSSRQNTFFLSHTANMALWIGMRDINGKIPSHWDDNAKVDFMSWGENEPRKNFDQSNGDCLKFAFENDDIYQRGYWYARSCSIKWRPICQKLATPGHDPNQPDFPQPEPHPNCEPGWFYLTANDKCHLIDHNFVSGWDAANSMCRSLGGELLSINDPRTTNDLRLHLTDPSAIG